MLGIGLSVLHASMESPFLGTTAMRLLHAKSITDEHLYSYRQLYEVGAFSVIVSDISKVVLFYMKYIYFRQFNSDYRPTSYKVTSNMNGTEEDHTDGFVSTKNCRLQTTGFKHQIGYVTINRNVLKVCYLSYSLLCKITKCYYFCI